MQKIKLPVEQSSSPDQAVQRFLDLINSWIDRTIELFPDGFKSDSHDGGTFMTPWEIYGKTTEDKKVVQFMRDYRDQAKKHFETMNQWLDGYWRKQEVHHGTEHFALFIRALWRLQPDDPETVRQLEDAAEHIGNWKAGFPKWFNWETGLFHSFHLGTEFVGEPTCNVPDHIRMVDLCLLAYDMTGRERYIELAQSHLEPWKNGLLCSREELPLAIDQQGALYDLGDHKKSYRSFTGAAPSNLEANLARAENLLASGVPDALLDLWNKTGRDEFREAAETIIDVAATSVQSPIAWQVHAAIRRYRQATASDRYDQPVKAVSDNALRPVRELTLVPKVETPVVKDLIGMRHDKPDWLDQDGEPAPSPLLWTLVAQVANDRKLLTRAVDLARTHFQLAELAFGEVTHHGCGSASLAAVCRGHGRLNNAGVVTEVLAPAIWANQKNVD